MPRTPESITNSIILGSTGLGVLIGAGLLIHGLATREAQTFVPGIIVAITSFIIFFDTAIRD